MPVLTGAFWTSPFCLRQKLSHFFDHHLNLAALFAPHSVTTQVADDKSPPSCSGLRLFGPRMFAVCSRQPYSRPPVIDLAATNTYGCGSASVAAKSITRRTTAAASGSGVEDLRAPAGQRTDNVNRCPTPGTDNQQTSISSSWALHRQSRG
jgi:hypothetical protein